MTIKAVKGMNDILAPDSARWEWVEDTVRALMRRWGYANIRTPIVEPTALFVRGLGEVTDIVEKEMYSFEDKLNGEKLTLRPEFTAAISSLRAAGIGLLNQTVLLGGVNARLETLAEHFAALHALGVKPYYLHHPDRVAGTPGFRVSIEQGLALYRALRGCIPGPAMPLYVIDLPDGSGKIPVEWLNRTADGSYRIEHPSGAVSHYCDIEQPSLID